MNRAIYIVESNGQADKEGHSERLSDDAVLRLLENVDMLAVRLCKGSIANTRTSRPKIAPMTQILQYFGWTM